MAYAVMTSGGKDSLLGLSRARRGGLEIACLVNIYERSSGRVRLHGVRRELIAQQAETLGLDIIQREAEADDFESVFTATLAELRAQDVVGVVFGNVHLSEVRNWYEERVTAAGLEHVEPIWGEPPIELLWEVVEQGYQAIVCSVDLNREAVQFLGRELDADLVTEMGVTDDFDPCGEAGEYHTFVYDGPEFSRDVQFEIGDTLESQGHKFIDLLPTTAATGIDGPT
jgi:uncharacterized protein (TIGR00290 family)